MFLFTLEEQCSVYKAFLLGQLSHVHFAKVNPQNNENFYQVNCHFHDFFLLVSYYLGTRQRDCTKHWSKKKLRENSLNY
jgi:hypothetical protein